MRILSLLMLLCLLAGCAVFAVPSRSARLSAQLDDLTVGQWCRVETSEYRQGQGLTKNQYIGRLQRVDGRAVSLLDVTVHTRVEHGARVFPFLNREPGSSEITTRHSTAFIVSRTVVTGATPISPEEAAQLKLPNNRMASDVNGNLDDLGDPVD